MDFIQAVNYMVNNPKSKLKASRWQDGYYITLHESKYIIITQDGDYYSPYPKTILHDSFEVIL